MVVLRPDSSLYKELFPGGQPPTFTSDFPSYKTLLDAVTDPSTVPIVQSTDRLNGAQARDIQGASRGAMWELAAGALGDSSPVNFPAKMLPGLTAVMQSNPVVKSISDSDLVERIMTAKTPQDVAGVVIGAALATLTISVPLIGFLASAIVGVATVLVNRVKARDAKRLADEATRRAALYKVFPPLQEMGGAETDGAQVDAMLGVLRSGDWTKIFAPRFKSTLDWHGQERDGGFAFAPGEAESDSDIFAGDVGEKFVASGGYGVIPGTDIVTSVLQVSLVHDPDHPESGPFWDFLKGKGPDPRALSGAYDRVFDVGDYYPSTGRVGAMFWELANATGNWYKYRIDALALLTAWKEYCDGAIRYIVEKCYPWGDKFMTGSGPVGPTYDPNGNYEGYFGTGIFHAVGVWSGWVTGGTNFYPEYTFQDAPGGRWRDELVVPDLYKRGDSINSVFSGAFLPIRSPEDVPKTGLGTIFDRGLNIKGKLEALRKRQRWELHHTLVSAYCSQKDAAFAGDKGKGGLHELLMKQRAKLLESEDRFYINLEDVPETEDGIMGMGVNWDNWKKQLKSFGVTDTPKESPKGGLKMAPANDPEPDAPPITPGPRPFGFGLAPRELDLAGDSGGGGIVVAAGVGLGLALTAALATAFKGRSRGGHPNRLGRRAM